MHKKKPIYLDYQGSTPLARDVWQSMKPYFEGHHTNPHASNIGAQIAMKSINESQLWVSRLLNCDSDEFFFTSGATESNNTALSGIILSNKLCKRPFQNKDTVIISSIEHSSISRTAENLAKLYSLTVKEIPVDKNGFINEQAYEEALTERVLLVSIMAVNNEIGTIQNIKKISQLAKNNGAYIHCDAAQMPLACKIDVRDLGVDLLSLSSHKMYGPKGIGALYVNPKIMSHFIPLIYGGGQQNGLRAGTLPTPLCVGFGRAAQMLVEKGGQLREQAKNMRDLFVKRLHNNGIDFKLNGALEKRHPGNLNVHFPGIDANHLLMLLSAEIIASQGSACNSGMIRPSKVLKAIGLSDKEAFSSIRFGFGLEHTQDEVIRAADSISKAIIKIKSTS